MGTLKLLLGLWMALALLPKAQAQDTQRQVVEALSARSKSEQKVVIRGLLDTAPQANGNVLMVFPGWPGIPRIELRNGQPAFFYLQQHVERMRPVLHAAGISLLTVDCPTDQWGQRGPNPSACDDEFRSSEAYADDVRRLIEQVRNQQTLTRFFAMGHSYGAISSHWLSLRLPDHLAGAIHSATQSIAGGGPFTGYAKSIDQFPHEQVRVPFVYLHHRDDLCRFTPYRFAQRQGGPNRLITVVGGNRWSDPCGKASYHSYDERHEVVGQALVRWINEGVVTPVAGNE